MIILLPDLRKSGGDVLLKRLMFRMMEAVNNEVINFKEKPANWNTLLRRRRGYLNEPGIMPL